MMIRTQVYITKELYQSAKMHCRLSGKNISQFLREGLALALEKAKKKKSISPLSKMVGKFKGNKNKDAALLHNDIYD